jgi:hypothetical protein
MRIRTSRDGTMVIRLGKLGYCSSSIAHMATLHWDYWYSICCDTECIELTIGLKIFEIWRFA